MPWYRSIWLSCEKATFLMGKKEEGKLPLKEKVQLRLHLCICDFCVKFHQQVKFFTGNARQLHEHTHHIMNEEKKASIKKMLQQ